MGDVSGHGFEAAVEMGSIRNIVRTLAFECEGPADVLKRAHNLLMANTSERFATAVVARFDPRTLHFEYACAGHQPPVLLMADGAHVLAGGGIPLGAPLENVTFQSHHVPLDHGAVVCLYTDGLVEYRRDIVAAEKRFLRLLTDTFSREVKAQAIIDSMLDGAPQSDDVALLLLRVEGPPVEDVRLALPAVPESAPIVRQYVRRFAQTHRLNAETTFRLLYVAGEAVANAVEHAHDPSTDSLQVLLSREGDEISLAVADRGRWKARPSEHRGRGLPLMRELCDSLEIEKGEHGIRVLARLTTVS
jgi:anti-sigma regulatory factor (Ser/Thr protein kinase)